MGLQCSRQARFDDLYAYDINQKRLAPEGQTFPRSYNKSNLQEMKDIVKIFENRVDLTPSLKVKMKKMRVNVLVDEENLSFIENNLVDLPPEGKVEPAKEFVELPKQRTSMNTISGSFVELPLVHNVGISNNEDIHNTDEKKMRKTQSKESLQSYDFSCAEAKNDKSNSENSSPAENAWSYTLYDFEGKDIVTKKDIHQLMESVCSAMDQSSCDVFYRKESNGHSLNLQLTLSSQNTLKANAMKSPNKYTPTKHYKGMIFPPPNTIEAEKVSSYIEEKLSRCRDRRSSSNKNKQSSDHGHQKLVNDRCLKDLCNCGAHSNRQCLLPKRINVHDGDQKSFTGPLPASHVYDQTIQLQQKSNSSFSPSSLSGTDTPLSTEEEPTDREIMTINKKVCSTTTNTTMSIENKQRPHRNYNSDDNSSPIRLRHSCSCHRQVKEKSKHKELNTLVDSESNLCKQIKSFHQETLESDESSISKSSLRHSGSSVQLPLNYTRQGSLKKSTNVRLKQTEDNCKLLRPLKKKNSRERTESSVTNIRPAVWPGECTNHEDSKPIKTKATSLTNTEQLCFCKRMLGLDYPCNHSNTVHHTHKHEHHHYHYYVQQSTN